MRSAIVGDYAISENFIIAKRILIDAAAVAGVALDGVDNAVFDLLDDTDMIGLAVLRTGAAPVIPIEKIIMPGEGSMALSAHCPRSRNHWTPLTQPANFGMTPVSI